MLPSGSGQGTGSVDGEFAGPPCYIPIKPSLQVSSVANESTARRIDTPSAGDPCIRGVRVEKSLDARPRSGFGLFRFRAEWKVRELLLRIRSVVKRYSNPRLSHERGGFPFVNRSYRPPIPQAEVIDSGLERYRERNWRRYFSKRLTGRGLEIGPLHRPLPRHRGMTVDSIDRYSLDELRAAYPELWEYPITEPTILGDAATLETVADGSYDFVIAAHVIEHMRNPLGAIEQWIRVLRPGGFLYLIVPDKRTTFDRHRVRTTVPHMVLDFLEPSAARDFEHFVDYAMHVNHAPMDGVIDEARRLAAMDYSIHFHVFIPSDMSALVRWFGAHVRPVRLVEGPCMAPGSDEFHLLIRKE